MENNIYQWIKTIATKTPEKLALTSPEVIISYAQLLQKVNAVAAAFSSTIPAESKILLALPNCAELVYAYLAASRTGNVVVPISTKAKAPEIEYILQQTQAEYIILHSDFAEEFETINLSSFGIQKIFVAGSKPTNFPTITYASFYNFPHEEAHCNKITSNVLASIFFSSGSTGQPKGIMHSQASLLVMAKNLADCMQLTAADRFLINEAMTNASGFSHLIATLSTGGTAIFSQTSLYDLQHFKAILITYQPTVLCIMGKLNYDIIHSSELSAQDFQTVRINATGGDKISKQLLLDFRNKTHVPLQLGYGMSEIVCITINTSNRLEKIGSIGTPPPNVKIRLRDANGNIVPNGKPGEVWVTSPAMLLGYWHAPELTQALLIDDWLRTGDLAYRDQDGYYWHVGRVKQLIIREGENISPLEIEEVLAKHPAIKVAAAVGKPEKAVGELPVAFVILKEGMQTSEEEIISFAAKYLEHYKIPVNIHFTDEMPLTKSNKIDRMALKRRL